MWQHITPRMAIARQPSSVGILTCLTASEGLSRLLIVPPLGLPPTVLDRESTSCPLAIHASEGPSSTDRRFTGVTLQARSPRRFRWFRGMGTSDPPAADCNRR